MTARGSVGRGGSYRCTRIDYLHNKLSFLSLQSRVGRVGLLPEKILCIPLLGAGRSKKGLDGMSPRLMVLLANVSPIERIGEKIGDPSSPWPPCPFPVCEPQRGGLQGVETKGYPRFFFPGKVGISTPDPFYPIRLFSFWTPAPETQFPDLSLSSSLPGKPPNSRRKLSKYL